MRCFQPIEGGVPPLQYRICENRGTSNASEIHNSRTEQYTFRSSQGTSQILAVEKRQTVIVVRNVKEALVPYIC
jgi:hypothetical protein